MRQYNWNGDLVWEHVDPYQHHDARKLAHGGAVYLAYAQMDRDAQAAVQGGVPGSKTKTKLLKKTIQKTNTTNNII